MNREMLKKWMLLGVLLLVSMLTIVGCGAQEENAPSENNHAEEETAPSEDKEEGDQSGQAFPVTITDDADREITIEEEPETIVSMQASTTEIVFELGLGDKVIGVSDYSNYPEETEEIEKLGGQDIKEEQILSLLPDIAFVTDYHHENHPDTLERFEEAGMDVVVIGSASSFEDAYEDIELVGQATGSEREAEETVADMKERLDAIEEKAEEEITEKKRVWVEVSPAPDIFTTGKNTFMHEMLESIQAVNVAEEHEGWVKLTEEEIVNLNPEVIITTYGYYVDNPKEQVLSREGWAEVPAVKNENVYDVDNDTVTRPGPRLIEGVETLAELIYPEVFAE